MSAERESRPVVNGAAPGSRAADYLNDSPVSCATDVKLRQAKGLDQRIRLLVGAINDSVDKLHQLVEQARETESYKLLGYKTMADYLADVFVIPARLDRSTRSEVVGFLSDHVGMSQRQIGAVIQVDHKTVGNDLRGRREGGENSPPASGGEEDVVAEDRVASPVKHEVIEPAPQKSARQQLEPDDAREPDAVLRAFVDTLNSVLAASVFDWTQDVEHDVAVQYVATVRDTLDAIQGAVDNWSTA